MADKANVVENQSRNTEPYFADIEAGLIYTSPSGKTFKPRYSEIAIERKRKFAEFSPIDSSSTYVQDNGVKSSIIPLKMWFVGPYHHEEAKLFEDALAERGVGLLTLPTDDRGARYVIPTKQKRTNKVVDSVNVTSFEVSFYETSEEFKNAAIDDVSKNISEETDKFNASSAKAFESGLSTNGGLAGITNKLTSVNDAIKDKLDFSKYTQPFQQIDTLRTAAIGEFTTITASIDNNISNALSAPLTVASQLKGAINAPYFSQTTNLFNAYSDFLNSILTSESTSSAKIKNNAVIQEVVGGLALSAWANKAISADYSTREDAIKYFGEISDAYDDFVDHLKDFEDLTAERRADERYIIDQSSYEALYKSIQLILGGLNSLLVDLPQETTITLANGATPINIVAEYYPDMFSSDANLALDYFEKTNSLTESQLLYIEGGTEIKVMI